jgi:hypothetical protein
MTTLTHTQIQHGRKYKLTGNTYENRALLRSIGAYFVDESTTEDVGIAKGEKYYVLDLSGMSKSAYQKQVQNAVFKLTRSGVRFEVMSDDE